MNWLDTTRVYIEVDSFFAQFFQKQNQVFGLVYSTSESEQLFLFPYFFNQICFLGIAQIEIEVVFFFLFILGSFKWTAWEKRKSLVEFGKNGRRSAEYQSS